MSCSSGSCTCGFVYKNKVRNSQASPSPQLLPATPLQAGDLLLGGGEESVLVVLWGTGSARKMEGGVIAPPGPRRRKLQLEQLAREPLACLWVFFLSLSLFFFFPFSLPSPLCSAGPCRPGNPHPSCPPPSTAARRGLGASGSPWAVTGAGRRREAPLWERLGSSLERAPGFLGESKNRIFFFNGQLLQSEGGRGRMTCHPHRLAP